MSVTPSPPGGQFAPPPDHHEEGLKAVRRSPARLCAPLDVGACASQATSSETVLKHPGEVEEAAEYVALAADDGWADVERRRRDERLQQDPRAMRSVEDGLLAALEIRR